MTFAIFECTRGGVHAGMVGSLRPTPVAILPFLSPYSAVAFYERILKHGTAWEAPTLEDVTKSLPCKAPFLFSASF